jgi:site-specific recombinase XerD
MVKFNRDLKTGDIFIHYHIAGKRFRASTGMRVSEKNWTGKWAKSSRVEYNGLTVNDELAHCQQCLVMAVVKLKAEGGGDIPRLKELYEIETTGKPVLKDMGLSFLEYFKLEYEKLTGSTGSHCKSTYNTLISYFGQKNPTFNQIDADFYKSFVSWCKTDKNYMQSTISSHLKWIKKIMGSAFDLELHKNIKYRKFKRSGYTTDKIALSRPELDKITTKVLSSPELALVRDYFLLSCYTGARVSDWQQFKSIMKDSKIWEYKSNKTKENAKVKITPEIIEIMQRYNWKLPAIEANQALNENIRKVCLEAEITDMYTTSVTKGGKLVTETAERHTLVSSHTGRRTFTTNNITDGMPVHLVMLQTGHKTLASLEGYIRLKELQSTIALLDWKKPE